MAKIAFEFEMLPPSVNHAYHPSHKHMYMSKSAKAFKTYVTSKAKIEAVKANWNMLSDNTFFWMVVDFEFRNNTFSDPNNMLKVLIDSFEGFIFKNDKWVLPVVRSAKVTGRDYMYVTFTTEPFLKEV